MSETFERDDEHQVTPLELFFDLVFVFAITQVTSLLLHDPTWGGVLRGTLVLAALWSAWNGYAWLTSAIDVDEGGDRLAMLAAMAAMTRCCSRSRTSSCASSTSSFPRSPCATIQPGSGH
jgi:low temperature requirement protein LtrA